MSRAVNSRPRLNAEDLKPPRDAVEVLRDASEGGRLLRVERVTHRDLPNKACGFILSLERGVLVIAVEDDLDTVRLSYLKETPAAHFSSEYTVVKCSGSPVWRFMVGSSLSSWVLTNQRGYSDGVQFESGAGYCVQLVAVGSGFVGTHCWSRPL